MPAVREGLRTNLTVEGNDMLLFLTVAVTAFAFVYLVAALIRPNWF